MLTLYSTIGIQGSFLSVVIGHVLITLPFVVLIVASQLYGFNPELEEAAMNLGASKVRTLYEVTLPLILPGIVAGMLFAFTLSFDNFTQTFFWVGSDVQTLPIVIYGMIQTGIEPTINAVGTVTVVLSLVPATVDTVAEGIADTRLLEETFTVLYERVDDVVSVSDSELSAAVAVVAERAKIVAEAAGVAPIAGLLADEVDVVGESVAAVVSGGNVNLSEHAELVRTGSIERGRYIELRIEIKNWPTGIGPVVEAIKEYGAELDELARVRRTHENTPIAPPSSSLSRVAAGTTSNRSSTR
jgi:hypothetical protein